MKKLLSAEAPPTFVDRLDIESLARGRMHRLRVQLGHDGAHNPLTVPVIVARAEEPGPVVGVTAVVHGNELNGIPIIHRLFRSVGVTHLLKGTLVAVPVVNQPGFLANTREFHGQDLNRIMPGKPDGSVPEVYAHRFFDRVVRGFEVLVDLHTASFGRVNSFYIRANLTKPFVARLARLIRPQIIVHNASADGTLRRAATEAGIHALTLEVGDPQRVQHALVQSSRLGIQEVLEHLQMIPDLEDPVDHHVVECARSYWVYTDEGGVLEVVPRLAQRVRAGEVVARLFDIWGDLAREYRAPEDGIVVGKSTNPVALPGSRVLHLGVEGPVTDAS